MRATIKDIAAKAGVSKTTVSFALNNPERISRETCAKILAIVEELGYVPNPVARTLTTKRLGALGLLLPQPIFEVMNNPYLCEVISGIGEECDARNISLTMLPPVGGRIIEAARRAFVDSVVTIGVGPEHEVVEFFNTRHIPFVTIDGEKTESTINIGIDDENASFDLMSHILSLGHRKIAVLRLKPDAKNKTEPNRSLVIEKRLAGFKRAMSSYGLDLSSPVIRMMETEGSLEGGLKAGLALLGGGGNQPSAIVAMADIVALGVYAAATQLGLSIPRDLSVAGFDDIPQSSYMQPPLTTVRQPARLKGQKAANLALALLEGEKAGHYDFAYSLEVRGSTDVPRTNA